MKEIIKSVFTITGAISTAGLLILFASIAVEGIKRTIDIKKREKKGRNKNECN